MRLVTLGGPKTGKSTYAIALYGGLVNAPNPELTLVRVLDDIGFLNSGLLALSAGKEVARTDTDVDEVVELLVRTGNGSEVELRIPDRSGELLKGMLASRVWDPSLRTDLQKAGGALLFVSARGLDPGAPADALQDLVPEEEDDGNLTPRPWDPSLMPTDARMVDALQEVNLVRDRPLPTVVVISAWDLVDANRWNPTSWLHARVPLMAQYLEALSGRAAIVFGVSGQGGDLRDPEERQRLLDEDPWERARAVDAKGDPAPLAGPLIELLSAGSRNA